MGSRGFDLSQIIHSAFHLFKGKLNNVCSGPCDGLILKMHYRWAFYFTITGFMTVWYGWYIGDPIRCVTAFKGDEKARYDYQNICLSYPFVKDENGKQRFLLFYRWVHWSFLLLSLIFYLPRKISKTIENPKAKKILEDLATLSLRSDQTEKEAMQRASYYIITNMRTHNSLYFKYLGLNILSFFIDIFVLWFFNFMFHDRFIWLVPNAYPFNRDPIKFTDYISQTFPPFASCYIDDAHKIMDGRKEMIGCHLTNMELFEKLFIIFWFFIYALITVTFLYNIYLLLMLVPPMRNWYIGTSKPLQATQPVHVVISKVTGKLKVGDIYMLYRLRQHLNPPKFYELLLKLGDPKLQPKRSGQEDPITNSEVHFQSKENECNLRNRHPNDAKTVPTFNSKFSNHNGNNNNINSNILSKLLNDPNNAELIKTYPKLLKTNKVQDTSILIE